MMLDDTLELLADENRRNILYALEDSDEDHFSYDEVTEALIEEEVMREEEKERFRVQMTHHHLPKMQESGLVEYDERSQTVRYVEDEDVEELLEFIEGYD